MCWVQGLETDARFQRQETMNTLLEVSKEQSNLPPESIAFIAPKNNSIKPLERLEAPPDMLELEANFVRNACRALGIPTSIHEGSRQACYRLLFFAYCCCVRGNTSRAPTSQRGATALKCKPLFIFTVPFN